jgi:hypothetical protein
MLGLKLKVVEKIRFILAQCNLFFIWRLNPILPVFIKTAYCTENLYMTYDMDFIKICNFYFRQF